MTQSGQGEEPSQRVAREGIVLPSDGGEPLLPGMTGSSVGRPVPAQTPPPPPPNPAGGQSWGQPWGPDTNQPQGQEQYQGQPQGQYEGHQGQYEGHPQGQYQHQAPPQAPAADDWPAAPDTPQHQQHQQQWGDQGQFQPQPPSQPQPQQQPEQQAQSAPAWHNDPRATGGWPEQPGYGAQPTPGAQLPVPPQAPQGAAPLPPATGGTPMPQHQQQPYGHEPHAGAYGPYAAAPGAPLPAPVDEGVTQYIPPVPGNPGPVVDPATQYLPPVAPHVNEAATQFLPPVGPGALPPEANAESTTYLGRVPQAAPAHPDAQATQYIPPVPAGPYGGPDDRQPPSDFDNLFRSGPGSRSAPAPATQHLPRIQAQQHQQHQQSAPYAPQQSSYGFQGAAPHDLDDRDGGRRRSRVPVIAAVGVGIAVLGIGAGALLSGGGDSDDDAANKTVAATSSASPEESAAPAADPAKAQAVELDKLLATSNNSRDAVISAVADVKSCDNLGQAATDLRSAGQQRGELVTRLSSLAVDKLPNHAELTTALTKAWQASQSADNHYAAWADQAAGKNGCRKGQARSTGQTQKGNQQSGIATTQKARAAELWNAIAKTYGLTERQSTQL
ncbi:hypothetical protein [Streptomyces geranii]|uniref:hypothetical protein n=1 Tax=Streptomyces geranii TaxID=2058923 RepID=UPI000D039A2D|nr:hypothetical protein [Streptomyces geranii]